MQKPLIHLLIIWSKGLSHKEAILRDIDEHFNLLNVYDYEWEKELFPINLKRFYAHSQKELSEEELESLMHYKIDHCGDGKFIAIVFEDASPVFSNRETSSGSNLVNTNVFDKKAEYRQLFGGGHKIHASDNYFESNKDISLLFGCTIDDYKEKHPSLSNEVERNSNIVGVPTWNSVEELFFVLNNTVDYVVMRNFECLPEEYHVEGHGDIDLLVEDLNYMKYLTGAKAVFPESYRVFHKIDIADEKVPFDFRFVNDNYYDKKWQLDILKNRAYCDRGFYTPNLENHFYSLLYHAYVQKLHVSDDYKITLESLASKIGATYTRDSSQEATESILRDFMLSMGYDFVLPIDLTVVFNDRFIDKKLFPSANKIEGELVSSTLSRAEGISFLSEVYKQGDCYVKMATNPIGINEEKYLTQLNDYSYFPKLVSSESIGDYTKVAISEIPGDMMNNIQNPFRFWTGKNIKNVVDSCIDILIILIENNISHRDIRLHNVILELDGKLITPKLIDFGWAVNIDDTNVITPQNLGLNFKWPGEGFSDAYSVGVCLKFYFDSLRFVNPIIKELLLISPEQYKDPKALVLSLKQLKSKSDGSLSVKNRMEIFVKRFQINKLGRFVLGKKGIKMLKNRLLKT